MSYRGAKWEMWRKIENAWYMKYILFTQKYEITFLLIHTGITYVNGVKIVFIWFEAAGIVCVCVCVFGGGGWLA